MPLLGQLDLPGVVADAAKALGSIQDQLGGGDVIHAMSDDVHGHIVVQLLSGLDVPLCGLFIGSGLNAVVEVLVELGIGVAGMVRAAADLIVGEQEQDVRIYQYPNDICKA